MTKRKVMTDGEKLFLTVHYGIRYDLDEERNRMAFIAITEFFKDKTGVDIPLETLYSAFEEKKIPSLVEGILIDKQMFETLVEYKNPLSDKGEDIKKELQK